MSTAELRRSRDVSERAPVKIEIIFQIRGLDAQAGALAVGRKGDEYAHQATDLIAKLQLTSRSPDSLPLHISSGRHRTASPFSAGSAL